MPFTRGKAKTGGRRPGARNKRTLAAEAKPKAIDHLEMVMTSQEPTITPDLKLRAAIALAQYQNSRPTPLKPVTQPISFEPPSNAQEARDIIVSITTAIARNEVDGEHGSRVIAGLEAYLAAKAAENEKRIQALEAALRGEA